MTIETSPEPEAEKPPAEPSERFAAELRERLSALSVRELARRSGWGRTTVHDITTGRRLPSADQLQDLLTVADAQPPEIEEWTRRRERLSNRATSSVAEPLDPLPSSSAEAGPQLDTPMGLTQPTTQRRPAHRRLRALVGIAAAVLLFAAGVLAGRWSAFPATPATLPSTTDATVANTAGLGVSTYAGPNRKSGKVAALSEGATIRVVCQDGAGERLTDVVDGEQLTWPVWNRLDDGTWVPDLYTNLSKAYAPGPGRTALMSC